jgi:TfoX/Sxy family transcriptional regulator of competence genes
MAYDEYLTERVRQVLQEKHILSEEKKMMGGLCFMVDDKMCAGIMSDKLMVRINPVNYESSLSKPNVSAMEFTGKPMKGFLFIQPEGIDNSDDLSNWVQQCVDFNPLAKSSKKKKK